MFVSDLAIKRLGDRIQSQGDSCQGERCCRLESARGCLPENSGSSTPIVEFIAEHSLMKQKLEHVIDLALEKLVELP
jgi:hypothetical protein